MLLLSVVVVVVGLLGGCCVEVVEGGWDVAQPALGAIVFGLDAVTVDSGVLGGFANGIGNIVYNYINEGTQLRPILLGTDQGQPFLITSCLSRQINNTVAVGLGYGRNFPAAIFTHDNGANWAVSSTHNSLLGLWNSADKTIDGQCYVVVGDWLYYSNPQVTMAGVGISCDGGDVYAMGGDQSWPYDAWPRFASFFNSTHGFVSGGYWPLSKTPEVLVHLEQDNHGADENKFSTQIIPISRHIASVVRLPMDKTVTNIAKMALRSNAKAFDQRRRRQDEGWHAFIARTTDGGQTYTPVYDTMGDVYMNQIQFVSQSVGFVVGEGDSRSIIMKTSDGGNTWTEVFETTRSLVALKMMNTQEGWAAGAIYGRGTIDAYFVRTLDGGNTWVDYPVENMPYAVWNIDGLDPNLLFAVAFNTETTALLKFTE